MGLQLSWLDFESIDNGDDTHTLEAMASVPPALVQELLTEVTAVLAWMHRLCPEGPQPLDEGGEWDLLLQAQVNDGAPVTLQHDLASGRVHGMPPLPLTESAPGWVCITLTLAATHAVAQALLQETQKGA